MGSGLGGLTLNSGCVNRLVSYDKNKKNCQSKPCMYYAQPSKNGVH